jgi:site-specific DNA-methyltransferase (adenine-specific)
MFALSVWKGGKMEKVIPYYEEPNITIYHGDCLDILPELPKVDLVLTDPPYNIGKDHWDRIDNYYDYLIKRFEFCEDKLKEAGLLWFFHISFLSLFEIHKRLIETTKFRHKQLIVLNKGLQSLAGRASLILRSFPKATEYLQFYTLEDKTGSDQLGDTFSNINPMAQYLKAEFKKAGITQLEMSKLFPSRSGRLTGCVSNWLLGKNFPLKSQYEKMREHLNGEYLRKEYEELRKEYEESRYTFDLPMGITDVWEINFYKNKGNGGHPTIKPIGILKRILDTTSKENDVVIDPFMGSGTTLVAAKELGRKAIGIEISKEYCEIAVKRLRQEVMNFTGQS